MPDEPKTENTQDLANTEYDAERWARVHDDRSDGPKKSTRVADDKAELGLSQKGTDEAAIVECGGKQKHSCQ